MVVLSIISTDWAVKIPANFNEHVLNMQMFVGRNYNLGEQC